ncbi:MAG: ATP-binding cassette domain-containing protein [Fimbriimonas sp.]|nr:ATP-binding cassette domain-containing protein [Fimbriimonas sp.]
MATLIVDNVFKRFGGVAALEAVSVEFRSGEIHAVLGENGAGKSTLMNVMSGFVRPDRGTVLLNGTSIPLGIAFACKQMGIEMIHQHFTLTPAFSVEENLALARLDRLATTIDTKALAGKALAIAKSLEWEVDPSARTGQLPVGVQQRIEILKALSGEAEVLIFDEPTAVLSPSEVEDLFRVLRRLRDEGKCLILIAHKLSEVLGVADWVTVLRNGRVVATAPRDEVDSDKLAFWMVGQMPDRASRSDSKERVDGLTVRSLSIKGDRGEASVSNATFEIRQGEILGFGGVDGNGQVELAETLAQIRKHSSGAVLWCGRPFGSDLPRIGYVPQDRQTDGLALRMSIRDNMLVSALHRPSFWSGPLIRAKQVGAWVDSLIDRFSIKAESGSDLTGKLSGGNQQKVIVSRILDDEPGLLVVLNPGRGLDIKATEYVYDVLLAARDRGAAIALFSTDLDELYSLSDRVLFMLRGQLVDATGASAMLGG